MAIVKAKVPMDVTIDTVFRTVKAIIASGKEEEFLAAARAKSHVMTGKPEIINLAKQFLDKHKKALPQAHVAMAAEATESPGGSCFPHPT
jgi:hypothetical protein